VQAMQEISTKETILFFQLLYIGSLLGFLVSLEGGGSS
jgi:hypothetical protein